MMTSNQIKALFLLKMMESASLDMEMAALASADGEKEISKELADSANHKMETVQEAAKLLGYDPSKNDDNEAPVGFNFPN